MARRAIDCKIYRNTATQESPTWSEVSIFENVTVDAAWDKADANARDSSVKRKAVTLLDLAVSGRLKKKIADTNYIALMNAMVAGGVVDMMVLDGAHTEDGVRGWRADYHVSQANEDQGIGNVMYEDLMLDPACTDNLPRAVLVASGVPTYKAPGTADAFA